MLIPKLHEDIKFFRRLLILRSGDPSGFRPESHRGGFLESTRFTAKESTVLLDVFTNMDAFLLAYEEKTQND